MYPLNAPHIQETASDSLKYNTCSSICTPHCICPLPPFYLIVMVTEKTTLLHNFFLLISPPPHFPCTSAWIFFHRVPPLFCVGNQVALVCVRVRVCLMNLCGNVNIVELEGQRSRWAGYYRGKREMCVCMCVYVKRKVREKGEDREQASGLLRSYEQAEMKDNLRRSLTVGGGAPLEFTYSDSAPPSISLLFFLF